MSTTRITLTTPVRSTIAPRRAERRERAQLTPSQRGRAGGLALLALRGVEYFRKIGKLGGGRAGGLALLERYGVEYFRRIGKIGNARLRERNKASHRAPAARR